VATTLTPAAFYRAALTDPYTAIKALHDFSEADQAAMTVNVFVTTLWSAYGGRVPTKADRRKALRILTRDLGRTYRKEIKQLVGALNEPFEAATRADAWRGYQLMLHIAAAICARGVRTEENLNVLIAHLVTTTYEHKLA
jgi:hypothetical protein